MFIISLMMIVPHCWQDHHRFILGKKGKKLQDLELATSTKIQVPNSKDSSEDIVVIGTRDSIEKAVHEIQSTSDEQVCVCMHAHSILFSFLFDACGFVFHHQTHTITHLHIITTHIFTA